MPSAVPAVPVAIDYSARLEPYSRNPADAVRGIQARISRARSAALTVNYVLEGDLARLRIPPPGAPRFAERLWQHTCFELFLRREGSDAYHELNFSPSGEWALYAFERYREAAAVQNLSCTPATVVHADRSRLRLEVSLSLRDIDGSYPAAALNVAMSAVIEDLDGALSYWALAHPATKPDFHHPASFALRLR